MVDRAVYGGRDMVSDEQRTYTDEAIVDLIWHLLARASEIDPQAWASPLPDHLASRRSKSMERAYAELRS